MVDPSSDTIVALSSGSGRAALAVIRLTGSSALVTVDDRFEGRRLLIEARGHTLHTGHLKDVGGACIDEVVVAVYRAPHSYTGEDVVEISCHGNPVIVEQVLASLVGDGVRLAETGDAVEAEGIRRSRTEQQTGDRILVVLDGAQPEMSAGERALLEAIDPERTVIAVNKIDLGRRLALPDPVAPWVEVSARTGVGLDELTRRLEASILGGPDDPGDVLVTGLRQERALGDAATATAAAVTLLETQPDTLELVAEELRGAANALGLITGERVGEDLLDVIFSEFCIGK